MNLNKVLIQIKKHDFTKELKDFEYETKFDIVNSGLSDLSVLKRIEGCFDDNRRFILVKVKRGDKLVTHVSFFTLGNVEYSLFKYRGARMVKIKKHKMIKGFPFFIFKNYEQLVVDKNDFSKIKDLHYRFQK